MAFATEGPKLSPMNSPESPIKVLHLSAADSMLYPNCRDQLCYLRDVGYEVHTACMEGPRARRLRDEDGFPWTALPFDREVAPLKDWRAVRFVERLCREQGFDLVHTHTPKGNLVGQWGARRAGVPIVLQTLHGFYFHDQMGSFERRWWIRLEKFSARHSDHILSQNPEDVDTAVREGIATAEQISLLGNGIDLDRLRPDLLDASRRKHKRGELGIPETALVVGMCGRFVVEKGIPQFLEAGRLLLQNHPDLHLVVVGHKLESERANEICAPEAWGLPVDRLSVLYDRDDMPEIYSCMDIHVLPSHREGFPRALMEGAACGLAQVASRIRGCRQTIRDGETGFLVPVKDVQELGKKIDLLLKDARLRERMGRAARQLAEQEFDQKRVFQRIHDCYRKLIAARGPCRPKKPCS